MLGNCPGHACARGAYVLLPSWVFSSLEAGRWVNEEAHEASEHFPGAKLVRSRIARGEPGGSHRHGIL